LLFIEGGVIRCTFRCPYEKTPLTIDPAATPPLAVIDEASIALLIDRFYAGVRADPVLAGVFETAIADEDWLEHIATMRRFWSSVMLASGRYSGNPVAVHRAVQGLERPMFAHWLALFEATATALFEPAPAALFIAKAHRIASSLRLALFHRLGAFPDGLAARSVPAGRIP
jgi:hemoglobin